jgi:hypothetical protein
MTAAPKRGAAKRFSIEILPSIDAAIGAVLD